jgi:hypothetical protein
VKNLAKSAKDTYVHRNKCCDAQRSFAMIAAISRFLDALFAPLAREVERMPTTAFRHMWSGF